MTSALTCIPSADTTRPARPTLRRVGCEPDAVVHPCDVGPLPPPPPTAPEGRAWPGAREAATVVLRIACEVLDGRRPPAHLTTHVDEPVVRYWRAAAERYRTGVGTVGRRSISRPGRAGHGNEPGPGRARFARMRMCHPHPGAAEVAVAVELDGGVRALAARFDHRGGRWRCTALRLG